MHKKIAVKSHQTKRVGHMCKKIAEISRQKKKEGHRLSLIHIFYLSSSDSGYATDFNITADSSDTNSTTLLNALGLGKTAKKIDGSDAVIVLNGVKYTSTTNNFSINGLSISVNGVTDKVDDLEKVDVDALDDSKAVSISTTTDTQGIYDTVSYTHLYQGR